MEESFTGDQEALQTQDHPHFYAPQAPADLAQTTLLLEEEAAGERSREHPGYDYKQTQKKIEQAIANGKPQRCAHIQSAHGDEHCLGCRYNGRITSPIQLGYDQPKNSHSLKNSSESEGSGAIRNRASGTDEVAQMYLEDARSELGLEETDPVLARYNSEWLLYNGVYWEQINNQEFISIVTRWGPGIHAVDQWTPGINAVAPTDRRPRESDVAQDVEEIAVGGTDHP